MSNSISSSTLSSVVDACINAERMMRENPIALRFRCHSSLFKRLTQGCGKPESPGDVKSIGAMPVTVDDDMPPSCVVVDMSDGSSRVYVFEDATTNEKPSP